MDISAYVKNQKIINWSMTITLIVVGVVMMSFGGYYLLSSYTYKVDDAVFQNNLEKNCMSALTHNGFMAQKVKNTPEIYANKVGLSDAKLKIAQSSLVIKSCLGYELKEYCVGSECDNIQGIEMTLIPKRI